jgi:ribosome-associated protein
MVAKALVSGDLLRITRTCAVPMAELEWKFTASGGPGGQHANTANTRVELVFDIENSSALGPRQRERLLAKLGPSIRVVASDERSQARNRALALDRLRSRLAAGLHVDRPRKATAPSRAAKERRLGSKHHRSEIKKLRRRPDPED